MNAIQLLVLNQIVLLIMFSKLIIGDELRDSFLDNENKNGEESSIRQLIQRAPPASFILNSGKLRGSASNDIVLMAALKDNGKTLLQEEILEEEKELIREKKKEDEKILEEEIETELEKENEEVLLEEEKILEEERNPNLVSEFEKERLDEEEVEAEREAVLLEEEGYPIEVDPQYTGARRLIHAYFDEDGRMHYEPLTHSLGHHNYQPTNYYPGNHHLGNHHLLGNNNQHLTSLLSQCLPAKLHHLIEQCREHSTNYHHY